MGEVQPRHHFASWRATQIELTPPKGFRAGTPAVYRIGYWAYCLLQLISPARTRVFNFEFDGNKPLGEICMPDGWRDLRPFNRGHELWVTARCGPQQWLARVNQLELDLARPLGGADWIPVSHAGHLRFVDLGPQMRIFDQDGRPTGVGAPAVPDLKGSSSAITFDHGWLALARDGPQHCFIWLDLALQLQRRTPMFDLPPGPVPPALCYMTDGRLLLGFGAAQIAAVGGDDVRLALG